MNTKQIKKDLEKLPISISDITYINKWLNIFTQAEGISSILLNAIIELLYKKYDLVFRDRYYRNGVVLEFRLKNEVS